MLLPPVDQQVAPTPIPVSSNRPPFRAQPAPSEGDTDGDGLSDAEEAVYGSDPLNRDYDGDGLADGEEVYIYGTDPVNNDTDGDSLLDGEENYQYGTNPLSQDSDGDGLGDADELFVYGTFPSAFDTDGDGIGDGEEVFTFGTNPAGSREWSLVWQEWASRPLDSRLLDSSLKECNEACRNRSASR